MIGTLLNGRFRLERKLGSGGMSTVYRAFDETLERWVAIKMMHSEISTDASQLERFRREARAVARLSHPHVVNVIDAGEDEGHPYIVLEYVEGETLKELIRNRGPLSVSEAVAYAIEVGLALSAAHQARLVHRDIKPQNVLIDRDGRAKVTDFGIARSLEAEGLTQAGKVVGTTDYVSPEQALGQDVTGQSDIYSLGICLYEMLTGQVPFRGETHVAVAMKHVQEPIPDVRERRPEVSAALALVVERATAKEGANRYETIEDVVHDLEDALAIEAARAGEATGQATALLQQLPEDAASIAPARLRRPRHLLAVGVLCAAAAAGVVAVILVGGPEDGPLVPGAGVGDFKRLDLTDANIASFDPPPGDGAESPDQLGSVVDGNPSTFWDTDTYEAPFGPAGLKEGVGLVIDAETPVAARRLDVITPTPGWDADIYAANSTAETLAGWGPIVGGVSNSEDDQHIDLDTAGQNFRYYLLWITKLPEGGKASISEVELLE